MDTQLLSGTQALPANFFYNRRNGKQDNSESSQQVESEEFASGNSRIKDGVKWQ
jgi:hypothetical protein